MVVTPVVVVAMTATVVVVAVVAMTVTVVMVVPAVAVPIVYPLNGPGLARRIPDVARGAAHRRSLCGHRRQAQREGTRRGDKPVLGCHRSFLISLASSGALLVIIRCCRRSDAG